MAILISLSKTKRRGGIKTMKKIISVLIVGLFVIISQTSEHTASVNDGSGKSTVVVWA